MSDSELLQVIYEKVLSMDKEMQSFRNEMQSFKSDMGSVKDDVQSLKNDMGSVKDELRAIHNRLDVVEVKATLTLEKVENLRLDMKVFERDTKKELHRLHDAQETLITVLEQKGILPTVK